MPQQVENRRFKENCEATFLWESSIPCPSVFDAKANPGGAIHQ